MILGVNSAGVINLTYRVANRKVYYWKLMMMDKYADNDDV